MKISINNNNVGIIIIYLHNTIKFNTHEGEHGHI